MSREKPKSSGLMKEESNLTLLPNSYSLRSATCFAEGARDASSSRTSPLAIMPSLSAMAAASFGNSAAFLTLPSSQRKLPNHLVTRIIRAHIQTLGKKAVAGGQGTPYILLNLIRCGP